NICDRSPLHPIIGQIAQGLYKEKNPPEIQGTGYAAAALEAALWAFYHGRTFGEGALLAVNLGDDADTTGAIYGQLAGAYYGAGAIPAGWLDRLFWREAIASRAELLYQLTLKDEG
ncbi:MAG TPA: ADP-ribosylglycohydrolase family protein, partial [Bacillota bacterium]|nr:ADP-ribosylglycohydrolase family protein [Bacillota bacterium]